LCRISLGNGNGFWSSDTPPTDFKDPNMLFTPLPTLYPAVALQLVGQTFGMQVKMWETMASTAMQAPFNQLRAAQSAADLNMRLMGFPTSDASAEAPAEKPSFKAAPLPNRR
jgi:hypothetical protein